MLTEATQLSQMDTKLGSYATPTLRWACGHPLERGLRKADEKLRTFFDAHFFPLWGAYRQEMGFMGGYARPPTMDVCEHIMCEFRKAFQYVLDTLETGAVVPFEEVADPVFDEDRLAAYKALLVHYRQCQ